MSPSEPAPFVRRDVRDLEALKIPQIAKGPVRNFAVEGQVWLALEALDPVTGSLTLIFLGPGTARRVRQYPPNWRDLQDIELYALSWSR